MKRSVSRKSRAWLLASLLAAGFGTALAQSSTKVTHKAGNPDADNSEVNKRYDDKVQTTADQQSHGKQTLEITRRIRSGLTDDKSLSTYAHNIKIIWQNGEFVLKGPLRSADEKLSVERIATKLAGNTMVKSEIEIIAK